MSIKKVIFLHHSTGANLIKEGVLRDFLKLRLPDVEFWDHGYNLFPFNIALFHHTGLTDAKGKLTGTSYDVPNNNTNPDGFENIFSQLVTTKPKNTFSHLIGYDVIVSAALNGGGVKRTNNLLGNWSILFLIFK
jgi:hypothetical protein